LGLELCGGYTSDDLAGLEETLASARSVGKATVTPGFGLTTRTRFLARLSVLAVPAPSAVALGTFIFESLAAGVPVAQPDTGGFSEVVNETGGGVLYSPTTADALADALDRLLTDDGVRNTCIARGHKAIAGKFNHRNMAQRAVEALP